MAVLQAKNLKAALERAKKVGLVEETVSVAGCQVVLQSLTQSDYEAIGAEIEGLEELAYLHAFQTGHLSRSIVEIDGVDLRDVEFIEDVAEDGKTIKLEKHAWIKANYLTTWSREAITSLWRKMLEVMAAAETKAKEGIVFNIAEETDEEKFRRLISEMKESAGELPDDLVVKILEEEGFLLKASKAELDAVAEKMASMQSEASATPLNPEPSPAKPEATTVQAAEELMRNRTPMNQGAVEIPVPQAQVTVPAGGKVEVPEAIRQAATPTASLSRAARIAAMEGDLGQPAVSPPTSVPKDVVELKRPMPRDEHGVKTILDRPPTAGINPRFQPPRRA